MYFLLGTLFFTAAVAESYFPATDSPEFFAGQGIACSLERIKCLSQGSDSSCQFYNRNCSHFIRQSILAGSRINEYRARPDMCCHNFIQCDRHCEACCRFSKRFCRGVARGTCNEETASKYISIESINEGITWTKYADAFAEPITLTNGQSVQVHCRENMTYAHERKPFIQKLTAQKVGVTDQLPYDDRLFFGGDLWVDPQMMDKQLRLLLRGEDAIYAEHYGRRQRRQVSPNLSSRWPREIKYTFDREAASDAATVKAVSDSIKFWQSQTCLQFEQLPDHQTDLPANYIIFDKKPGCSSYHGMIGGPQPIHVGFNCERFGVLTHELAHALGIEHEQARPDRQTFVEVKWDNVDNQKYSDFAMCPFCATFDIPYDYGSVMHYNAKSFSKNDKHTLIPRDVEYLATIGGRMQGPTFYDVQRVNDAYCKDICPQSSAMQSFCLNGGYLHPGSCRSCICPEPYEGTRCGSIKQGHPESCGGTISAIDGWQFIQSPNYPETFAVGQKCTWQIKAPQNSHVQLEFIGATFDFISSSIPLCFANYVELRYGNDLANTGPKFCGTEAPSHGYLSETNEMIVMLRSFDPEVGNKGFQAQFRAVSASVFCFTNNRDNCQARDIISVHGKNVWNGDLATCQEWCTENPKCQAVGGTLAGKNPQCILLGGPCLSDLMCAAKLNALQCSVYSVNLCYKAPKNCRVSPWTVWGVCSANCGPFSVRRRIRQIEQHPEPGGEPCPLLQETKRCDVPICEPPTVATTPTDIPEANARSPCYVLPCDFSEGLCSWYSSSNGWQWGGSTPKLQYSILTGILNDADESTGPEPRQFAVASGFQNENVRVVLSNHYTLANSDTKLIQFKYWLAMARASLKLCIDNEYCTCDSRDNTCLWRAGTEGVVGPATTGPLRTWRPCADQSNETMAWWNCEASIRQSVRIPGGTHQLFFIADGMRRFSSIGLDSIVVRSIDSQTCSSQPGLAVVSTYRPKLRCFNEPTRQIFIQRPFIHYIGANSDWDGSAWECQVLCTKETKCKSVLFWAAEIGGIEEECSLFDCRCSEESGLCPTIVSDVNYWERTC